MTRQDAEFVALFRKLRTLDPELARSYLAELKDLAERVPAERHETHVQAAP